MPESGTQVCAHIREALTCVCAASIHEKHLYAPEAHIILQERQMWTRGDLLLGKLSLFPVINEGVKYTFSDVASVAKVQIWQVVDRF
jgi:hypothetical protein